MNSSLYKMVILLSMMPSVAVAMQKQDIAQERDVALIQIRKTFATQHSRQHEKTPAYLPGDEVFGDFRRSKESSNLSQPPSATQVRLFLEKHGPLDKSTFLERYKHR